RVDGATLQVDDARVTRRGDVRADRLDDPVTDDDRAFLDRALRDRLDAGVGEGPDAGGCRCLGLSVAWRKERDAQEEAARKRRGEKHVGATRGGGRWGVGWVGVERA